MLAPIPVRVLRLTPFFHHEGVAVWPAHYDAVGGMQQQILQMSRWLASHGVHQTVLTLGFPGVPRETWLSSNLLVRVERIWIPEMTSESSGLVGLVPSWFAATVRACVKLRRGRAQFDLVHVHADGQPYSLWLVELARRLFGVPIALTVHCSRLAGYEPISRFDAAIHRLVVRSELRALRQADTVFSLTDSTADRLRRSAGSALSDCRVIPDTIDAALFGSAVPQHYVDAFAGRFGLRRGRPIVAYVGRIAPEKGWPALLHLGHRLRPRRATMLVVGDGPQRARLERLIDEEGLREIFVVSGFVSHQQVRAALRLASVVVMPSHHEELGGTALEAMASRVPVVAYAVGGLRHTVGQVYPKLLAAPGDIDGLAARVVEILDYPERYSAAVDAADVWVREHHDVNHVLGRLLSAYHELALGRRQESHA